MQSSNPAPTSTTRPGSTARVAIALVALAAPAVHAQVAASTYPAVRLQPGTPGNPQVGHANISGMLRSGSVRTDWFRLTDSSTPGFVLTTDASGIGTWQPAVASGLVLPFAGSASSLGPVFYIENLDIGPAIRGENSGQFGDLGSILAGVYGLGDTGVLGQGNFFGVRGEHVPTGNFGYLGDPSFGAYGESDDPFGAGVRGVSDVLLGPAAGVHGSSISTTPAAAGVRATGDGASGPGLPNAAALQVDNGAITVSGPLPVRASGTIVLPPAWVPIISCDNTFGPLPHNHTIGHYADVVLLNDLILPGPPNVGSMIMASVETVPGPPTPRTSFYVQVWAKMPGTCTFRVTRMGSPDPMTCPLPGEVNYVHYTIINPL